jgi:molybdopterin/thiamine biosynthesis adenylyltransferase
MDDASRLRVKPEHAPYRTAQGNVRIGGVIFGIGAEIHDPAGWLWTLVNALDGSHNAEGAATAVCTRHPEVSRKAALSAISRFDKEGFLERVAVGVEDSALPAPPSLAHLSEREQERYSRGVTLMRWMDHEPRSSAWEPQVLLHQARVLVVGLGGTGTVAVQALVTSGVGAIHCMDGDVVELSNLNRQVLYTEADIGLAKVDAAVGRLSAMNSDVEVSGERASIGSVEHFTEILTGHRNASARPDGKAFDLVLLCADGPPGIRRWANQACLTTCTPWVTGGYRGPLSTAAVFAPWNGPCWECLRMGERDRRDLGLAPGQDERVASPRMQWNPANAISAGTSGYFIAHAGLALLTGIPKIDPGFRFGTNLALPGEPVLERYPRRSDCPDCGGCSAKGNRDRGAP